MRKNKLQLITKKNPPHWLCTQLCTQGYSFFPYHEIVLQINAPAHVCGYVVIPIRFILPSFIRALDNTLYYEHIQNNSTSISSLNTKSTMNLILHMYFKMSFMPCRMISQTVKGTILSRSEQTFDRAWNRCPSFKDELNDWKLYPTSVHWPR